MGCFTRIGRKIPEKIHVSEREFGESALPSQQAGHGVRPIKICADETKKFLGDAPAISRTHRL